MKRWTVLSGLIMAAGLLLTSHADARTVRGRIVHENMRIRRGVVTHTLTPAEARRLHRRERRITRTYRRDERTGHGMSWAERRRMERRLNRQSRRIYRHRHD